MSLRELMVSDITDVFLDLDDFATQVLRYVDGVESNTIRITGIVTLQPAIPDDNRGRGYLHRADLMLKDTTAITATDAIKCNGQRYEVEAIGDAERGMRMVSLIRYQPETQGIKPLGNGDH